MLLSGWAAGTGVSWAAITACRNKNASGSAGHAASDNETQREAADAA